MQRVRKKLKIICILWLVTTLVVPNAMLLANSFYNYNALYHAYVPGAGHILSLKKIHFISDELSITVYARDFAQGNAMYVEITKLWRYRNLPMSVKNFLFNNNSYPLKQTIWGYRGLGAIHPSTKPGNKEIVIPYIIGTEKKAAKNFVMIRSTKYLIDTTQLQVGQFSDVTYHNKHGKFIQQCQEKKNRAFSTKNSDLLGPVKSHPRTVNFITSPFWSQRKYERYILKDGKKVNLPGSVHVHQGLDLYGETGDLVFAIADGKVVLAEKLFYEGNIAIIDHGNQTYSYYMHLSGLKVKKGEQVCGGELIGLVGSTGVSTASHLHVSFVVRGVQVDPLSILPLPIRN